MRRLLLLFGILSCWVGANAQAYTQISTNKCVSTGVDTLSYTLTQVAPASGAATITFYYQGDLDGGLGGNEYFRLIDENNTVVGVSNCTGGCTVASGQCLSTQDSVQFTISQSMAAQWTADGSIDFKVYRGTGVSQTLCTNPGSCAQIKIEYTSVSGSCPQFTNFKIDSITGTGAKVSWTPGTGNSSFYLEYGTTGFTPGSGTSVTGTYPGAASQVIISTLSPLTSYDVYFGEICNSGADSVFFPGALSFMTTRACAAPDSFQVSNVLANSADFNWTSLGNPNSFNIIYGQAGFNPATTGGTHNALSSPTTVSGLNGATDYEAYLYADCGATDGNSDTIGPIAFRTPCVVLTAPFTENFDGPSWVPRNGIDACWTATPSAGSTWSWEPRSTPPTSGNGPLNDFTGGNFMYCEASLGGSFPDAELVTPPIDVSSLTTPALYFQQHRNANGGTIADMRIEVSNDLGVTWDTVYTVSGQIQTANADPWILEFVNLGAYTGDTVMVKFLQQFNGCCGDAAIDSVVVAEAPTCPWPTSFAFGRSTTTTATVSWNDPSGSSWNLEWGPTGFTQGTGASMTTTNNPDTLTGLSPNTTYDVYIRTDCSSGGNGFSIWIGPLTFTTQCSAFTAPYTNNFDNDAVNTIPSCWNAINDVAGPTKGIVQAYTFVTPNSTPNHVRIYNGSGNNTAGDSVIFVSPNFSDLTGSDKRIQFFGKGSTAGTEVVIGTMADYDDAGSFAAIDTIVLTTTHTFYQVNIDAASGYNGTHNHIAFLHNHTASFRTIYVDDFKYEQIPACVGPLVTTLGAAGISPNSANVYWSGGAGDTTKIEWGPVGFIPGSGSIGSGFVSGSDTTYTITGLFPQTTYEFYVQDSCAVGGSGAYVGPFTFTTSCLPVTAPYFEDFDGTSWVPRNGIDVCWSANPNAGSTWSWEPRPNAPTSGNGPLSDYTGGNFMYCEASLGGTFPPAELTSPNIDVSGLTIPAIYFQQHRFSGATIADMDVEVSNDFGFTWTTVYSITGDIQTSNSAPWQEEIIPLPGFIGDTIQVRFTQTFNGCCGDAAIDSFVVAEAPSCPDLTNLNITAVTDTGVTLGWTGNPNSSQYQVWVGPVGFYQGSQTTTGTKSSIFTASSFVLDTLTPNTCYDFMVRGICGANDTGNWVGPFTFCTFCSSQLSGTYTINSSLPTGGTNFNSFADAGDELSDCGVSGPVVFNVQAGTYLDHLHMIDVPNISSTNTVTFNGGGATITHNNVGPQATILIDNSGYITIDDLNIVNNSLSEGWGIFLGGNSDSVFITNSTILVDSSGNFRNDVTGILVSGDPLYQNDFTYGADVDYLTVSDCEIYGGYTGIMAYGVSTSQRSTNYTITNNTFKSYYLSGIYFSYLQDVLVKDNTIRTTKSVTDEDGIYLLDVWDYQVEENDIYVKDWALYIQDGNDGHTTTTNSIVVNNMITSERDFAFYMNNCEQTDVYHNTTYGNPALYLINPNTLDIQNNIFSSPNDFAFETNVALPSDVDVDYNLYYSQGATPFDIGVPTYANLAAWQAADATRNVNSVEGDPVFINAGADLHVLGSLANDAGNSTLGITVDIDGDTRPFSGSTVVDIGADEFQAVSGDLALLGAEFLRNDPCLTINDTIALYIFNLIGPAVDFSVDPLTVNYAVTGPITTSGSRVVNTGTLNPQDSLILIITPIDMSSPGTYTINANIMANGVNTLAINDTLGAGVTEDVDTILSVTPKSAFIINTTDSVELTAKSPFFPGGGFMITEICHFKTASGTPVGGFPAYLSADDYIEITGVPGSDLGGYVLEQWSTAGLSNTHTFPPGTVLSPNGTAIIAVGSAVGSTPSPSDFYYHGNVTLGHSSGSTQGRIIKDPAGNIVDAVGYGPSSYIFPAASGVTIAEWAGGQPASTSTSGIRLEGADMNSGTNWVPSATSPQDPNTVNSGVTVPAGGAVSGFQWTLNGNTVTTDPQFFAGPYPASGVFKYVAELVKCGTTYYDTVTVTVVIPTCPTPPSATVSTISTSSGQVSFDTTGYGSNAVFIVEYGPRGFNVGSGTKVAVTNANSTILTGLAQNLCVDVYMRVVCTPGDTSFAGAPAVLCPDETICVDDIDQYVVGLIEGQSALFLPWEGTPGNGGTASVSTAQANSGTQSLRFSNPTNNVGDHDDIVAYFDTISTGAWDVAFDLYVPASRNAYFNIQQNHVLGGTGHTFGGEIYFQGNGTAQVQYGAGGTIVGTFSYTQGQWNTVSTIIDLGNDTIWFELNGTSTGVGFDYSAPNPAAPLQFNALDFFTGKLVTDVTSSEFYIDDFCISPYTPAGGCADPTALAASNITCDGATLGWTSTAATASSMVLYGTTGFNPSSGGTLVNSTTSSVAVTSLTANTGYDFYVIDICANGDTSGIVGPASFTTASGPLSAAFTPLLGAPGATSLQVIFDASASVGASSYAWDFGDGSATTVAANSTPYSYLNNGTYTVKLVISGACGVDSVFDTITIAGISIDENALSRSLSIYPNPATDKVRISFENSSSDEAVIRLLDLSGKAILQLSEERVDGKFDKTLDISKLAKGVYVLEIESGDAKAIRRIIKD